jgi:hypothetical protein
MSGNWQEGFEPLFFHCLGLWMDDPDTPAISTALVDEKHETQQNLMTQVAPAIS